MAIRAIRKLRNIEARGGKIPAIALTAYAHSEDRAAAIAARFQVHLPKPFEPTAVGCRSGKRHPTAVAINLRSIQFTQS